MSTLQDKVNKNDDLEKFGLLHVSIGDISLAVLIRQDVFLNKDHIQSLLIYSIIISDFKKFFY